MAPACRVCVPSVAVVVSVANEVGLYQTQVARVAWTQKLEYSNRVIAGVEFHERLKVAV